MINPVGFAAFILITKPVWQYLSCLIAVLSSSLDLWETYAEWQIRM